MGCVGLPVLSTHAHSLFSSWSFISPTDFAWGLLVEVRKPIALISRSAQIVMGIFGGIVALIAVLMLIGYAAICCAAIVETKHSLARIN